MDDVITISFEDFRLAYRQALINWLEDERINTADIILSDGIPQIDQDNLSPFIDWAYMRLHPDLPDQYFLQTNRTIWAISGGECMIWTIN